MAKVAVLTTQTTHHAFFVRELARMDRLAGVVIEQPPPPPSFTTHHPFEDKRTEFEREELLGGKDLALTGFGPHVEVSSVNAPETIGFLRDCKPDLIVDFGTGIVREELIGLLPDAIVNLHGGDPEEYRGLDSHLWAIYHRDQMGLTTTLHRLSAEVDAGDIVLESRLPVRPGMQLHQLRAVNAAVCVELTMAAVGSWEAQGRLPSRPQRKKGRYYSYMPTALKELCVSRFERLVGSKG